MHRLQLLDQFLGRKSRRTRTSHEITDQLIQASLTLRGIEPYFLVADKCSRALLGFEHAANFKFAIRANHRIRIDGKIDSQLPYGGELITRGERASGDASGNLVNNLAINGYAAARVERERESLTFLKYGVNYNTNVLVF